MRDGLVLLMLVAACGWSLRHAWIGAIAWTVLSLGSPHVMMGYQSGAWPVATAVAVCTLISFLYARERQNPFTSAAASFTLALALWMCITLPFSLAYEQSYPIWERSAKIFFMLFVSMALLTSKHKLQVFIWANVAAVGFYGVKGGFFAVLTGGSYRIWGPGGFIGENNALALALIMVLPLMRYLQQQSSRRWVRLGFTGAMVLTAFGVLASQSRGAFVGSAAMALFFWLKGDKKLLWGFGVFIVMVGVLSFMPAEWWERMGTIRSYEDDVSAQGRLNAWAAAWNIATHRITGGGCAVAIAWINQIYAPNPDVVFVAHSIYFQMLGEQGFIGLFLFLGVFISTWFTAGRMVRLSRAALKAGDESLRWAGQLGAMIQVSLVGYAVTGAFLSLAYFDLPYNLMAMAVLGFKFARAQSRSAASAAPAGPDSLLAEPGGPQAGVAAATPPQAPALGLNGMPATR